MRNSWEWIRTIIVQLEFLLILRMTRFGFFIIDIKGYLRTLVCKLYTMARSFLILISLILVAIWKPISLSAQIKPLVKAGATHAVVIGISDYQDKDIPDLRFAHKDAEAFANYLRSPAGGALDDDHLKVLTNEQATAGRIAEAFDALVEQTSSGDQVIIYFSGHGDVERKTVSQPGFLLAWDAPSRVYMGGGTYSLAFLQEIVTTLSTQNLAKVTVITDACHAGKLSGSQIGGAQLTSANLARQYANEIKILSCQPNEFSLEGEQWGGGRGNFSYHLVEALYGLADRNEDDIVTVGELDRYLEDNVTGEAAPQSQVPMLLGNKTDQLASVNAAVLADLKKNNAGEMPVFAALQSRGMEDQLLATVDSGIRDIYLAFRQAMQDKLFFEPAGNCTEDYYAQLMHEQGLSPLRSTMTRNYAAALQDDAQQAMNIWLKADVQQLECIGKSLKLGPIPLQLERAAELLGKDHYMFRSLQARQLLFEGIIHMQHSNPDEALGRACLSLFRQSLALEPQSPLPWHRMSVVYVSNLRQPDSAFVCAQEARNLAPNWVLPFADLAYQFIYQRKHELAKQALMQAEAIDSLHPYVINRWAIWYSLQKGQADKEKAVALFEKYRDSGGVLYPCWFSDYSLTLMILDKNSEAEEELLKAIELDSTNSSVWNNLGLTYFNTRRYAEEEHAYLKAIELDSTFTIAWGNLGLTKINTRRYAEAEHAYLKAIALDSTIAKYWYHLGSTYFNTRRYAEAEHAYLKAIELDSTISNSWNHLGLTKINTRRYAEAEHVYLKAITLDSTIANYWNHLGLTYFNTRRYAEAEHAYLKAIALDSTIANYWNNLGLTYLNTRRYDEAELAYLKAIALDSTYSAAWNGLGFTYDQTHRYAEAEHTYLKALALDSTIANYWNNLGSAYLNTRRYAEAEHVLGNAIALDSTLANPRKHLGMVYFKTNRPDEARQNFLKAIDLNPNYTAALLGMAYLLTADGKTSEAIGYVEQAIGKGSTFEQLEKDEDLAPLRALQEWKALMKKHFAEQGKNE